MKFEIIFLGLLLLMAHADKIFTFTKQIQTVPTTTYATTTSYYLPGKTTISSFTKTAPLLQNTQVNVQSSVAPTFIQAQGYIQPVNNLAISATRYGLTSGANTFMTSSGSSYVLTPTFVPKTLSAPAPAQTLTSAPVPTPTPIPAPSLISTPDLVPTPAPAPDVPAPSPAPIVNQLSTPTYSPSFSPAGSLKMPPTSMAQSIPTTNSLASPPPSYPPFNSMSGENNGIIGINNSGSGNNNQINGENNCLNGDRNFLMGGSNLVEGDSNTISGDQNYVTGSSNTVMNLPGAFPASSRLVMEPNVIASGTLPPPPPSLLM